MSIDLGQTVAEVVHGHSECAAVFHRYRIDPARQATMTVDQACAEVQVDRTHLLRELESAIEQGRVVARAGSFEWDISAGRVRWSRALCNIYGIEPEEFAGTYDAFLARVHPDDRERTEHVVAQILGEPEGFTYEHRIIRADGEPRILYSRADLILDDDNAPLRLVGTCWDVTDKRTTEDTLAGAVSLLRGAFDATADGLLVVDRSGRVTAYNQQFLELWRIPTELAHARSDGVLLAYVADQLADPQKFVSGVDELYASPERESFDVLEFKDGRVFERRSRPQRVEDVIVGRVWSFHDVTRREHLLRARDELTSIVAHEVRGPLTSIQLAVESLRLPTLPPDHRERAIRVVVHEIKKLTRFVDDLLDIDRVRTGRMRIELEDVELGELVREVVAKAEPVRARSGSPITVDGDRPVDGHWDRLRIEQVVGSLVDNAIKFGLGAPIEITVRARDDRAILVVADHGIGVTADQRERIFQPLERAVSVRHYGGLGLGLFIVHTIVKLHGGTVHVEPNTPRGSRFVVELPQHPTGDNT